VNSMEKCRKIPFIILVFWAESMMNDPAQKSRRRGDLVDAMKERSIIGT
jgi:hypothetical protein